MSTQTADPYVTCDQFCGRRIQGPEDHAPDCGADAKERERLIEDLTKARFDAALPDDEEDGDDEDEYDATVDGEPARVRRGRKKADSEDQPDYRAFWINPEIADGALAELQRKVDEGEIHLGGIPAGKCCNGKMTREIEYQPVEIGCPHLPVMRTVRKNECSLAHTHTETLEAVCLYHGINLLGAGIPIADAGPLFAIVP